MKRELIHNLIFFTNVLRTLEERGMTKSELAERSGISVSFLSNLTTGKANPSLKVMTVIALALDKPLSFLLESTDWNKGTLDSLTVGAMPDSLPPGYERISVVLPKYQAFLVKKWGEQAMSKLEKTGKILLNINDK